MDPCRLAILNAAQMGRYGLSGEGVTGRGKGVGHYQITGQVTAMVPVKKEQIPRSRAVGKVGALLDQVGDLGDTTGGGQGVPQPVMTVETAIPMAGDKVVTKSIEGVTAARTRRQGDPQGQQRDPQERSKKCTKGC